MKETDFKDRVPQYPGRVILEPVAGTINTFTMSRADEPTEEGTPLDKATFNSIIQSRLTGRYYPLSVARSLYQSTPIESALPSTGGWTVDSTGKVATKSVFKIEASSISVSDYSIEKAVDGKSDTSWSSADGTLHTFTIIFPYQLKATTLKMSIGRASSSTFKWQLRGSNDKSSWVNLTSEMDFGTGEFDMTIPSAGDYVYYQVRFVLGAYSSGQSRAYIKEIALGGITANTYNNVITTDGMPINWTQGQRVTVQMPGLSSYVTSANTFMGVPCNTILQSNKRYELRYNGSSFDAKEV